MLARHLVDTGQLRTGVEVYDLLVLQRGWTRAAYAQWRGLTLIASLVTGWNPTRVCGSVWLGIVAVVFAVIEGERVRRQRRPVKEDSS